MRVFPRLLGFLLIASFSIAQLPDAPSTKWTVSKPEPRGRKKLLLLAGSCAFEILANRYDTIETERGLRLGVAVEDNTWLVGSRPSARALYARDFLTLGMVITPSLVAYKFRKMPFFYAGTVGSVVMGIKHIRAGNRWKQLINGGPVTGSEFGP